MGSTVDAVMEERPGAPGCGPGGGLFSRKRLVETEQLYDPPEPEPEELPEIETIGPEPPSGGGGGGVSGGGEAARRPPGGGDAGVGCCRQSPMALEAYGWEIAWWTGNTALQCGVMLACLAAVALLGRHVIAGAIRQLAHRRCTADLLAAVSLAAMAADCGARLLLPGRSPRPLLRAGGLLCHGVRHVGRRPGEPGPVGYLPHGRRR